MIGIIGSLSGCIASRPQQSLGEHLVDRMQTVSTSAEQMPAPTSEPSSGPSDLRSFAFELRDNLVTMPVVVNGHTITGVLDSGSGSTLVDRGVSREIGLFEEGEAGEALGGGTEAQAFSNVTIDDFLFGPVRLTHVSGYAFDLGHLTSSAGFPVELVVGAPVLEKGAVRIDYGARQITFAASGALDACEFPISFELIHDVPVVKIQLRTRQDTAPVDLKVMVDLGSRGGALNLGGPFLRTSIGEAFLAAGHSAKVGHGVGGEVHGIVAESDELRVGGLVFTDLRTQLTSQIPAFEAGLFDGTLGVPLWQNGKVTFDYPARQLCIEPVAADVSLPSNNIGLRGSDRRR